MTEKQVVKYDVTEAAISEMRNLYMDLTITDIEDKESFDQVHSARMVVKGKRVAVENQRKVFKKDALEYGRKVDAEAKKIFELLAPIEDHLTAEEKKVTDEQKRIKEEKERLEKEKIKGWGLLLADINIHRDFFDLASMTDEEFNTFYNTGLQAFNDNAALLAAEKIEKERLEKEREELRKAEDERLKKEREELEAEKKKLDAENAKIQADQDEIAKKLLEEQAKIDAANKAIQEAKDREEFERKAKIQAEIDAKTKIEREAKAKAEVEAKAKAEAERQSALLPDKEKLNAWASAILAVRNPDLKTKEAMVIFNIVCDQIDQIIHGLEKEMERL